MSLPPPPPTAFSAHDRFRKLRDEILVDSDEYRFLRALAGAGREFGLPPSAARLAAEVAALEPGLEPQEQVALTVLAWSVLAAAQEGSVRLPLAPPTGGLPAMLARLRDALAPRVEDRPEDPIEAAERYDLPLDLGSTIRGLLSRRSAPHVVGHHEGARTPLVQVGDHIYSERHLRMEQRLVTRVLDRVAPRPTFAEANITSAVADVASRPPVAPHGEVMTPNEEQLEAVRRVATRSLALLSGGPGTGKTYTAASMLRVLVRLGLSPDEIALTAPTGKAAQRMREAIMLTLGAVEDPAEADRALAAALPEPRTLHRLLGYSPRADRFRHHGKHPIPERVVLVDEASMADLRLAERLFAAVRPDARLVLIGDADQLPSVAAGAVFRDLVDVTGGVRLTESYRMRPGDPAGREILSAAQALRGGQAPEIILTDQVPGPLGVRRLAVDWSSEAPGRRALASVLDAWYAQVVTGEARDHLQATPLPPDLADPEAQQALGAVFAELGEARILCVTRRGPAGVHAVNRALHQHVAGDRGTPFSSGEPVLVTENDYELSLFNGDQGVVAWIGEQRTADLHVVFPRPNGRYEAFPLAAVKPRLDHAYALTVHKAQGSEYRRIAVVLPPEDVPLLSRELVYTALTRASKAVLVVGDAERLADAAGRSDERHCGVAERLGQAQGS